MDMRVILDEYLNLLEEIDGWFAGCVERLGAPAIQCRSGCSGCCRGLFDISLLDARLLQQGLAGLPLAQQHEIRRRAGLRLAELQRRWPDFAAPFLLNRYPDDQWTEMPEDDLTPCVLLGDDGRCLVYRWRPMTCRLHGLPNIDLSGESFSDAWCTLNFVHGEPLSLPELRWAFRDRFTEEIELLRRFSRNLVGEPVSELDTFIPTALLIDFTSADWPAWWRTFRSA